jgi:hypothetical protein
LTPKQKRAIEIRDAALRIMRQDASPDTPHRKQGLVYTWDWRQGNIWISRRTWPHPDDAALVASAIEIWIDNRKVMNIEWTRDAWEIVTFRRGDWENQILSENKDN